MRVGLMATCHGDETERVARGLWELYPFSHWYVPVPYRKLLGDARVLQAELGPSRVVSFGGGCVKSAVAWLHNLDVVVAVGKTWPDNLFQHARSLGVRTALVGVPGSQLDRRACWVREADAVAVPDAAAHERLCEARVAAWTTVYHDINPGFKLSGAVYPLLWEFLVGPG
jgi:hypothetical protein